ncbi:MAG: hypothetical protein MRJ96_11020 [Nitrospirales bacterium]|nr:hypothetical protein [Nitrospira sp.]MDR4501971.1 hypothetical protein [Nitrospirales bacterium]
MKRSTVVLLTALGLVFLLNGCQQPYKTGSGESSSGSSGTMSSEASHASPKSPAGRLQECLDSIGDVSPGQKMLAEATCHRNAKTQEAMDKNPGDYLPPPK